MPQKYVVQPGDCLLSLAARAGIPYQRIVNHPENRELIARRGRRNHLLPGDEIVIPERELHYEDVSTNQRHRFVKKSPLAEIRIALNEMGRPRANERYYVEVNGKCYEGDSPVTDEEGLVVCRIPADAEVATIVIGPAKDRYELQLGHVDPVDTVEGMHGRLANLGFYDGGVYTEYDAESITAMTDFLNQKANINRDATDWSDKETRSALVRHYGC